ncbi:HSP20 family protein [Pedobacter cryoconitis]|uniref:HSP20 family protein n=1 Tax=Pedobacter cryoconitis TaxID=188932 RepID=A0A7W8YYE8_9SPHI|nr:Hsp20/alpha crystallin family protein [Pedobacter cryoconitis]MBB5624132.1 HSP20 family protein [Pedobacter cryoconitis]MBB5635329.1 HSP20 family protein [Pedobacter cryoconitis]MBB6274062.1 HSP20 family protein [Pedobacter cryoconitis]
MTLVKFNPNGNVKKNGLMTGFDGVFDSIFNDTFFSDRMTARVPAVNISESKDHYHVELAAPGLKKEDFKLSLERNVLSISVERSSENGAQERNYNKREFSYSSFVRSFTLPDAADENGIEAKYMDGVLCIDIAKREEAKIQSRQIEIK